jgi:hypothetical protein
MACSNQQKVKARRGRYRKGAAGSSAVVEPARAELNH